MFPGRTPAFSGTSGPTPCFSQERVREELYPDLDTKIAVVILPVL
jgi:hypothetical protein